MCQLNRGRSIFDERTSIIRIHHTEIPAACSSAAYSSTAKAIGQSGTPSRTTQASAITTTVPSSSTTNTVSSLVCPAANKANYTAINLSAAIPFKSLTYQVLCNINFQGQIGSTAAVDLQIVNNVTSFKGCLDACALYYFQTPAPMFPSLGRTGLAWNPAVPDCWLKSNINLSEGSSANDLYAAILIYISK